MKITGIICEYNPLHLGHFKQLSTLRQKDPEGGIVCLMSGNYVQRGHPAIFHKSCRAQAALRCGADLVLELPVSVALSSAEGFAAGGVQLLGSFCDSLSFGAETPDASLLQEIATALLSPDFSPFLKEQLTCGTSFPVARQKAIEQMGLPGNILSNPNNILAVEYCKAILTQKSNMSPEPILRLGNYNDNTPDASNPSATAVRHCIENHLDWLSYIPSPARQCFQSATPHTLVSGERAILGKLRSMTEEEYSQLPYSSEGLWRKLMKNSRTFATLEEILTATKSKRYTRTRLDRMVLCAFLGIHQQTLQSPVPYCRVLALNDRGRILLSQARKHGQYPNLGQTMEHGYQRIEDRCESLYGLFSRDAIEPPETGLNQHPFYAPSENG